MSGYDSDVVVIGSGFGGAVMACRLAERGQQVIVLERGRRWQPEEYPRSHDDAWWWDDNCPQHLNGWAELQFFDDMAVARGAGVGGGSLIYASVSVVPPKERFAAGWPAAISYREMLPYYERVGRMLKLQTLPQNQLTRRYELMRESATKLGMGGQFRPVELAVSFDPQWHYGLDDPFNDNRSRPWTNEQGQQQGTCVHCGNCDAGCQVRAKNTLDLNYIAQAERHGAQVRPLHIARNITPVTEGGYRVEFEHVVQGRLQRGSVTAKRV
ncbi:MAG TPA: FAD-binding protein, partial [Gammaproteobacteria bacterium]